MQQLDLLALQQLAPQQLTPHQLAPQQLAHPTIASRTTTPFTSATKKRGVESCAVTLDFVISFAKGLPEDWTTAQVWCISIMC